jgi:hypothetical protein
MDWRELARKHRGHIPVSTTWIPSPHTR